MMGIREGKRGQLSGIFGCELGGEWVPWFPGEWRVGGGKGISFELIYYWLLVTLIFGSLGIVGCWVIRDFWTSWSWKFSKKLIGLTSGWLMNYLLFQGCRVWLTVWRGKNLYSLQLIHSNLFEWFASQVIISPFFFYFKLKKFLAILFFRIFVWLHMSKRVHMHKDDVWKIRIQKYRLQLLFFNVLCSWNVLWNRWRTTYIDQWGGWTCSWILRLSGYTRYDRSFHHLASPFYFFFTMLQLLFLVIIPVRPIWVAILGSKDYGMIYIYSWKPGLRSNLSSRIWSPAK